MFLFQLIAGVGMAGRGSSRSFGAGLGELKLCGAFAFLPEVS
jgi:hypothetical protein